MGEICKNCGEDHDAQEKVSLDDAVKKLKRRFNLARFVFGASLLGCIASGYFLAGYGGLGLVVSLLALYFGREYMMAMGNSYNYLRRLQYTEQHIPTVELQPDPVDATPKPQQGTYL